MHPQTHSRKDLVLMKLARLGRSICSPEGDAGQKVSPVQKLGCGTHYVDEHLSWLPQILEGEEPGGNLLLLRI